MKGRFITFEGGDGAGKSTLMEGIYRLLTEKGGDVLMTRAPGGTDIGKQIRSLLLHATQDIDYKTELFLFLADRAQHVKQVVIPALTQGMVVLCDRYNDSTIAYQGIGRGLHIDYVRDLCNFACAGVQPDLTLYIDLDPRIGLQRREKHHGTKDRLESEKIMFHESIREAFHHIALQEPQRVHILDGMLTPEQLLLQAEKVVYAAFSSVW